MPVLFTSTKKYSASKTLFEDAIYKIAGDDTDELFHSKHSCTNHDCRIGEYCFCEAVKVDLSESEDKCQKIIPRKRRINFQAHSQAQCVCFAHYLKAIELHEKIANEVTGLHSLDPRNYLFNRQEEGDYLFGQGIIN
jgi:hypothetical protein